MKIISFAWTTPQLLARKKTVTRRDWNDGYARQFKTADMIQAYDKSARNGGKRVALIKITNIRLEPLALLTSNPAYGLVEIGKEGGLWKSPSEFVDAFQNRRIDRKVWRVEFEIVSEEML